MAAAEGYFQHLNTSCGKLRRPNTHLYLFVYALLSLMSLLTAALNLLVIISISHFKQLHTPTNLLLLSLAFSDFFVSFLLAYQISHIEGCLILGDLLCVLHYLFGYVITSTSVGNIVLITVDRYVAICDPLHYSAKVTQGNVRIGICLCWICSLFWNTVMLRDSLKNPGKLSSRPGDCLVVLSFAEQVADLAVTFVVPIALIMVLYARVFAVAVSQARAVQSILTAAAQQQNSKAARASRSELKAARSLGVVVAVFLICLLPYYCVLLANQSAQLSAATMAFILCVFFFNSCLNPLIYAFFYPWFRRSIRLILTLQILKPDSRDSKVM